MPGSLFNMLTFCRNRLENNAEYWNALLLSLRELIEWVIRKDTELSSLTLVRENPPSIQKQQVIIYLLLSLLKLFPL